jgi:hypothetical protein
MRSIDLIKNSLIDKILTIKNQDFLVALEKLIDSSSTIDKVELTEEQKLMLLMSEDDIKAGRLISQDEIDNNDLAWLKEQSFGRKQLQNKEEKF